MHGSSMKSFPADSTIKTIDSERSQTKQELNIEKHNLADTWEKRSTQNLQNFNKMHANRKGKVIFLVVGCIDNR